MVLLFVCYFHIVVLYCRGSNVTPQRRLSSTHCTAPTNVSLFRTSGMIAHHYAVYKAYVY